MSRVEHLAEGVSVWLGDCREIVPTLGRFDLCLTDPPYGIGRAKGMGGGGFDGFGKAIKRKPKDYDGEWDKDRPTGFEHILSAAERHIIWGGNYFSDLLPVSQKWLWWDKLQTMPSFSDGELAWTSLSGTSTKKFTYNGSGLMAKEKDRQHPTQKPVALMGWCIEQAKLPANSRILDPYAGSGTTGVAAVQAGMCFTGVEIDPHYFDVACQRIAAARKQADMFIAPPKPAEQLTMLDGAA